MSIRAILVLCGILCADIAVAQPSQPQTTYTFTFDGKQIDTIGKALGAMPFNEVAPLIQQLGREINEQNAARAKPVQAPEPAK